MKKLPYYIVAALALAYAGSAVGYVLGHRNSRRRRLLPASMLEYEMQAYWARQAMGACVS